MNRLPKNPIPFSVSGCYLAGGSILSIATKSEISDYDIYPKSKEAMIDLFYDLEDENCFVVNISDRAVTWKSNDIKNKDEERAIIQVMTFDEFDTPQKIFDFFDFSVCMGAFDSDTEEYHFHPDFWPSIASRTLYFNPNTRYPLNSSIRVGKYTSKGYYLPKTESIKMSLAVINAGMPTSWEELEGAIGGTYGRQVKLAVGEREFSYEAALEILNDLVLDIPEDEEDFSMIQASQLENLFKNNSMQILSLGGEIGPRLCSVSGSKLFPMTSREKEALDILGVETSELEPTAMLEGYKVFKKKTDGTYENIIHSKKLSYCMGDYTEELKSPHIFVFPTPSKAEKQTRKEHVICKVSFFASDVVYVSENEYKVKKVYLEEEVTL